MPDKLLIDECLSTALVVRARERGHLADHVTHLGLAGRKDRELMPVIRNGDYLFVAKNRLDFLRLRGAEELHNGLVVIVPNVRRERQLALFDRALDHLETLPDLVNRVLLIQDDGSITVEELAGSSPPAA